MWAGYCRSMVDHGRSKKCATLCRCRLRNARLPTLLKSQILKSAALPVRFPSVGRSLDSRGFSNPRILACKASQSERLTLATLACVHPMYGLAWKVSPIERPSYGRCCNGLRKMHAVILGALRAGHGGGGGYYVRMRWGFGRPWPQQNNAQHHVAAGCEMVGEPKYGSSCY